MMAAENTALAPSREVLEKSGLPIREIADMSQSLLYNVIWPTARNAASSKEELDRIFEAFCQSLEALEQRYDQDDLGPIDRKAFFRDAMNITADSRYLLMGPPGHGKTSVFRETARLFAEKLGAPFLVNPGKDEPIPQDAYVFYVIELADDPASTTLKFLSGIDDGNSVHMKPDFIHVLEQAKYGMLVFDNLANASPQVVGALRRLVLDRHTSIPKLPESIAIGATGNLDALLDGSDAQEAINLLIERSGFVIFGFNLTMS